MQGLTSPCINFNQVGACWTFDANFHHKFYCPRHYISGKKYKILIINTYYYKFKLSFGCETTSTSLPIFSFQIRSCCLGCRNLGARPLHVFFLEVKVSIGSPTFWPKAREPKPLVYSQLPFPVRDVSPWRVKSPVVSQSKIKDDEIEESRRIFHVSFRLRAFARNVDISFLRFGWPFWLVTRGSTLPKQHFFISVLVIICEVLVQFTISHSQI